MSDNPQSTFTIVFEGDIRAFEGNPFQHPTGFGKPIAIGVGNVIDDVQALEARIAELEESLGEVRSHLVL